MIIFLVLLVSLGAAAYFYATRHFGYWKKLGVFHLKPVPFIGNLSPILTRQRSIGDFLANIYNENKDQPYVGIYLADTPCLVLRDLDLINRILIHDFHYFNKRSFSVTEKTDYIVAKSLFVLHDQEWKNTRAKMSSVFSPKRQKIIFDDMIKVGDKYKEIINEKPLIELNEISASIAADMISKAVLGFEGNAMANPHGDKVRELGTRLFSDGFINSVKIIGCFLFPETMKKFGIRIFSESLYDIMRDAMKKAIQIKKHDDSRKGDYIDALLEMMSKGPWEGNDGEIIVPNDTVFVTQLFIFFAAGFETVSSGITYALYELAKSQDIQNKIRSEYEKTMKRHNGVLCYESLNEMTYLSNFIQEVLRLHPSVPFLDRVCLIDYTIPGTNITINKGVKIMVPLIALHRNEMFFDNPMSLIPERFDDDNLMKKKPNMPFSVGARICLGMRYALQVLKIVVLFSVMDHSFTLAPSTPTDVKMDPSRFSNIPKNKLFVEVR